MRRSWIALPALLAAAVGVAGCGGSEGVAAPEPAERPVPPAAARPSTQVASTAPALARETVARGFDRPTGLVREPGARGRTLVLEQRGTARWIDGNRPAAGVPFLDLRAMVRYEDEQGLLGLAFLPDYVRDPRVAVHYNDVDGHTRVVVFRLHDGFVDPLSANEILFVEQPYGNHNGGQMAVGPDGQLYVGLGDGGSAYDPRQNGQDLKSRLGKVLRYDLRVKRPEEIRPVAATTPSDDLEKAAEEAVEIAAARWQVVAYGLRDPWRLAFDGGNGDLWIADAGRDAAQRQTQEIDRIPAGRVREPAPPANFGWAAFDGVRDQSNREITMTGPLSWPTASYVPARGCGVTGGLVVRERAAAESLRGRYVFGDACSGRIWSVPSGGRARDARADDGSDAGAGPLEMRTELPRVRNQTAYVEDHTGRVLVSSAGGSIFALVPGP